MAGSLFGVSVRIARSLGRQQTVVNRSLRATERGRPCQRQSCVEIFLCPSGVDGDVTQLLVVPEGLENAPRMRMIRAARWPMPTTGVEATWTRTDKGHTIDVLVPWSKLKGYKSSYKTIPVEIGIDYNIPGWPLQCRMNASLDCPKCVRGYALLKTK